MPTSFKNSPYFLCHYGVKGQKHGIRRYQNEDGSYTSLGRDHYGIGDPRALGSKKETTREQVKRQVTEPNNEKAKKRDNIKKAIKIAAGAAGVAALGFIAYKKATKLRDVMRANASEEAQKFWSQNFGSTILRSHYESDARDSRAYRNYYNRKGDYAKAAKSSSDMVTAMKKAREESLISKQAKANYEKYKNISETATRRDAVRLALNERVSKGSSKKAKDLKLINALNDRQKSAGSNTRWSIDGSMYKLRRKK